VTTEATCSATSKAIAAAIFRGHATVGRLHATRRLWHLTKPTRRTQINACTVSAPANLKPHHDIQGTTVNWVGEEPRLACCVCDSYQQAINTRIFCCSQCSTRLYVATQAVSALMKAIVVTGQMAGFTGPGSGPR